MVKLADKLPPNLSILRIVEIPLHEAFISELVRELKVKPVLELHIKN